VTRLKNRESIADLWGYPEGRKRPSTEELFSAVAAEAEMCLRKADWDSRIRRIENILSVIKWRIREFWENKHHEEVMKNVVDQKG
jgi:hypothetical protein